MNSPATLKAETAALCLNIEQLEEKLRGKTIAFDDAQRLWSTAYRPKARILAEAMLYYVPSNDQRISVEFESGGRRDIKSDAVNYIEEPLSEELASIHLSTVTKQLRDLTSYLPTEATA